jgi:selenium metabolism protein YedF
VISDQMGRGDDELGRILIRSFMYSLARNEVAPEYVMLANSGVRLACEGSEVLDDLMLLTDAGVHVRVCGTCLDFLKLKEALRVGEIGTMPDSVAAMMSDKEIVTIA